MSIESVDEFFHGNFNFGKLENGLGGDCADFGEGQICKLLFKGWRVGRSDFNEQTAIDFGEESECTSADRRCQDRRLYIQAESPGKDKESNWLPAPAGNFSIWLRTYWPDQAILDGTWKPPVIATVK